MIIGAGAAGVFCAVNAAENLPHATFAVLESTQSLLAKVKISGGGRCNVTHHCFEPSTLIRNYPRGAQELRGAFTKFQPRDTVQWFAERGVALKVEDDGRMFPVTDSSMTVIQCLLNQADRLGVSIQKGRKVVGVTRDESGTFHLRTKDEQVIVCRKLMIATGSSPDGHELAKQLGHTITPLAPSLFTFKITDPRLAGFAGVSFPAAELQLLTREEKSAKHSFSGPLLITHWGLSGPAVLKLSAFAAHDLYRCGYKAELKINFLGMAFEQAEKILRDYTGEHPKRAVQTNSPFAAVPQRWWAHLCGLVGIAEDGRCAELRAEHRRLLVSWLTQGSYEVSGKGVFKDEFVTAGGVALNEVDFRTMESRIVPGLYFAGEVLNIDGITGGFNFQNAWTTAVLAARAWQQS